MAVSVIARDSPRLLRSRLNRRLHALQGPGFIHSSPTGSHSTAAAATADLRALMLQGFWLGMRGTPPIRDPHTHELTHPLPIVGCGSIQ